MKVNSIDEYGIIARLKASKTKESKEALILIKGLQDALKRQKDVTNTAITKVRSCSKEIEIIREKVISNRNLAHVNCLEGEKNAFNLVINIIDFIKK